MSDRDLQARVRELEARIAQLEAGTPSPNGGTSREPAEAPVTRRQLLSRLGVAGAAAAGGVLLSARPAAASNGDPVILGQVNTATATTQITSPSTTAHIASTAADGAPALFAEKTDTSAVGPAAQFVSFGTGNAILANVANASNTSGAAVRGEGKNATAVLGTILGSTETGTAVKATNDGLGDALSATVANLSSNGLAVSAISHGMRHAIYAQTTNASSAQAVVQVERNAGSGHGVNSFLSGTASGAALRAHTAGVGQAIRAIVNNPSNGSAALSVEHQGVGVGANVDIGNVLSPNHALNVSTSGTGIGIAAALSNASNSSAAVHAFHNGVGPGIQANLPNPANPSHAIFGLKTGAVGDAVFGDVTGSTSGATSLRGRTAGTGRAIHGQISNSANTNSAIFGETNGVGAAIHGISTQGLGVRALRARAPILLHPAATAGPPAPGEHAKGELYVDSTGAVYQCVADSPPGVWRKLAAAAPGYQDRAGSTNFLASPARVYDSRPSAGGPGKLAFGSTTHVQVTGVSFGGVSVPAGAIGLLGTLTITDTEVAGHLNIYPTGSPPPAGFETSAINWFDSNQTLATGVIAGLNSTGQVTIHNGLGGTSNPTHFILDVAGFVF